MKTKFLKRIYSILAIVLVALIAVGCGNSEPNAERQAAKEAVEGLLAMNFGDTSDTGVVYDAITGNIGIVQDADGIVSEEDVKNNSYSEFVGGVTASFTSSNPEVMNAEWVFTTNRVYEYAEDGKTVIGIKKEIVKNLLFVVNRQEEDTQVEITMTATKPYEVNGVEYKYTKTRTFIFTVAAKEVTSEAVNMTIAELNAAALADWSAFEKNGLVDENGNAIEVRIEGIVTEVLWGDGYDNHSFMISDGDESFYVYAPASGSDSVEIGDRVAVTCIPTYYYSIIESKQGTAKVEVLLNGQEIPAAKEYTVDGWYEAYPNGKEFHDCPGQRVKIEGVLQHNGTSYILKSQDSDKEFEIYYKGYTAYEQSLLDANLGKLVKLEAAIYDYHSKGYYRLLANVYDYPIESLVLEGQAALDADASTITTEFTVKEGESISLPTSFPNGSTLSAWVADKEGYINLETLVCTLGSTKEDTVVKLTATLSNGGLTKEVVITVNLDYVAPVQKEYVLADKLEVGVAYKYVVDQTNIGKVLYFAGAMDSQGKYFASTEDSNEAVDVYLEAAEGGYYMYFLNEGVKTYMNMASDGSKLCLEAAPSNVWVQNEQYNTFFTTVESQEYYVGMYNTFETFSRSKTSYLTNEGQCPARFYVEKGTQDEQPEEPKYQVTTEHEVGKAYKFGLIQGNLENAELFLNGELSGNFFATTTNIAEAADVYLEATEGGYYFYFVKGSVKKYICIANDTGYISFADAPSNVWTYNAEYNTLVSAVYNDTYYLGTYNTFNTISKSKLSFAATSFVAHLYTFEGASQPEQPEQPEQPSYAVTTEHEVGTAYKFGLVQGNLENAELFLNGELSGNFFATTTNIAEAADVYLEATEGGYYFYFVKGSVKKYICIANDTGYISFADAPSNVWTYNAEYNTLVSAVYNDTYYLGTYNTFNTISKSKLSFAATSFVAHLYTFEGSTSGGNTPVEPEVPTHTHVACPTCGLCTDVNCDGEASVKCEGHQSQPEVPGEEKVVDLTVNSLGLPSDSYTAGTITINGVAFEYVQLGNYGDGIQMRDKNGNTSKLWSTSGFGAGIVKIELTYSSTKEVQYANANAVIFSFGNAADNLTYSTKLSTTAGVKTYTITPDVATYTFLAIEHDLSYSMYWDSIKIYYTEGSTSGGNTPVEPEVPTHTHVACPTCGLCTDVNCDGEASVKCAGHPVHEHQACPECNKCLDPECEGEKCEGHQSQPEVPGEEKVVDLTVNSLGLPSDSYTAGTITINGVAFEYVQLGNYGDGIQMRDKNGNTSKLWSTSGFGAGIVKIELTYSSTKEVQYANANAVIFSFGNAADNLTYSTKLSTTAGVKTYTITPDVATYTFLAIEHDLSYSMYWDSIKIYYTEGSTSGGNTPVEPEVPTHTHVACPTCGLCTDVNCDGEASVKCAGHPVHEHQVCPECNKCLDPECEGEKCEGHNAATLEVLTTANFDGNTHNTTAKSTVTENGITFKSNSENKMYTDNTPGSVCLKFNNSSSSNAGFEATGFSNAISKITFKAATWNSAVVFTFVGKTADGTTITKTINISNTSKAFAAELFTVEFETPVVSFTFTASKRAFIDDLTFYAFM